MPGSVPAGVVWLRRVPRAAARRLALDRNPLRRRRDRIRVWAGVAAVILMAVTAPLVARPVMGHVHQASMRLSAQQASHRYRVSAFLLREAKPVSKTFAASMAGAGVSGPTSVNVPARWRGPDGRPHLGTVKVDHHVPAGQAVPIWLDGGGRVTTAPLTGSQANGRSVSAGSAAAVISVVAIGGAYLLFRRWLDRMSATAWELQWAVLAPQWTRKY